MAAAHFSPAAVEVSWSLSKQLCWRGHARRCEAVSGVAQWPDLIALLTKKSQQTVCFWSDIGLVSPRAVTQKPLRRVQDLILSWRLSFTNKNTNIFGRRIEISGKVPRVPDRIRNVPIASRRGIASSDSDLLDHQILAKLAGSHVEHVSCQPGKINTNMSPARILFVNFSHFHRNSTFVVNLIEQISSIRVNYKNSLTWSKAWDNSPIHSQSFQGSVEQWGCNKQLPRSMVYYI